MIQLQKCVIQHDGALENKASRVKKYLVETFWEQKINYCGFVKWPVFFPDQSPMDIFHETSEAAEV